MTSRWVPSTEQVRSHYVFNQTNQWDAERGEAFDRWLAAHDAEVQAGVVTEEPEWEYDVLITDPGAPVKVHRRRKAGPWVEVSDA